MIDPMGRAVHALMISAAVLLPEPASPYTLMTGQFFTLQLISACLIMGSIIVQ
jgi:hypothetical protein